MSDIRRRSDAARRLMPPSDGKGKLDIKSEVKARGIHVGGIARALALALSLKLA